MCYFKTGTPWRREHFKPRPHKARKIFVPLRGSFQNFWRAPPSFSWGRPPLGYRGVKSEPPTIAGGEMYHTFPHNTCYRAIDKLFLIKEYVERAIIAERTSQLFASLWVHYGKLCFRPIIYIAWCEVYSLSVTRWLEPTRRKTFETLSLHFYKDYIKITCASSNTSAMFTTNRNEF